MLNISAETAPGGRRRPAARRAALLGLLQEPGRLHSFLRHLLALPLGPDAHALPSMLAPHSRFFADGPLLCRLPSGLGPPWCLFSAVLAKGDAGWSLCRPWLAARRETAQAGWLVLLTDCDEVARRLQGRRLRARYGPCIEPVVLHLGRLRGRLLSPAAPLLAPLAVFAAQRAPAAERALVLSLALRLSGALPEAQRERQVAVLLALADAPTSLPL